MRYIVACMALCVFVVPAFADPGSNDPVSAPVSLTSGDFNAYGVWMNPVSFTIANDTLFANGVPILPGMRRIERAAPANPAPFTSTGALRAQIFERQNRLAQYGARITDIVNDANTLLLAHPELVDRTTPTPNSILVWWKGNPRLEEILFSSTVLPAPSALTETALNEHLQKIIYVLSMGGMVLVRDGGNFLAIPPERLAEAREDIAAAEALGATNLTKQGWNGRVLSYDAAFTLMNPFSAPRKEEER